MAYKYFIDNWAVAGDVMAIPDPTQPGGSVSYSQGFGPRYQADLLTDPSALPVPRAQFNQLMSDITTAVQQYQNTGVPPFITTALNGGVAYPYTLYALALYDPGTGLQPYISLKNSNTDLPTVTASWMPLNLAWTTHGSQTFIANGTFIVPAFITTVYVSGCAGGGGGAGGVMAVRIGGGGGGGGAAIMVPISVTPGQVITITIGAGGTGGAGPADGTTGTATSFGSLLTLPPGAGGIYATNTPSAAGNSLASGGGSGTADTGAGNVLRGNPGLSAGFSADAGYSYAGYGAPGGYGNGGWGSDGGTPLTGKNAQPGILTVGW